jgi:hypothetical protein
VARPRRKDGCGHLPSVVSPGCFFGAGSSLPLPQNPHHQLPAPPPPITMLSRTSQRTAQVRCTPCARNGGSMRRIGVLIQPIQMLLRGAKPARCGPSMVSRSRPTTCRETAQPLTGCSNGHGQPGHLQAHQVRRQIHRDAHSWYAAIAAARSV